MKHPAYSQLRPVSDNVAVVLAPNPSYFSLEGTNSWVIRGPEDSVAVVVDPGPHDEGHLNVLNSLASGETVGAPVQLGADGKPDGTAAPAPAKVGLILLTHRHDDHAAGAERFRQMTGAPIRAFEKHLTTNGEEPLRNGEFIRVEGLTPAIEVVHTPGHTADCVCFFIHSQGREDDSDLEMILTGDTIAGRHTTMISETDGDLGQYLDSLEMLRTRGAGIPMAPGHGPDHPDVSVLAQKYLDRRHQRLRQVQDARQKLGRDAEVTQIVDEIYTDVDPVLREAAAQSTRVTLRYLDKQNIED